MIYHILSANVYTKRLIELFIKEKTLIDINNHFFYILGNKSNFDSSVLARINYKIFKNDKNLILLSSLCKLKPEDKIIFHSLSFPYILIFIFLYARVAKHVIWSIWGSDLYFFENRKDNLSHSFLELIRINVIPKIAIIAVNILGEFEIAQKKYNTNAKYCYVIYPTTPILAHDEIISANEIIILAGNSVDISNNHFEILELLSKYKNEKIKIYMPLSYGSVKTGNTQKYINSVILFGKNIFGEKFLPMLEFMEPDSYSLFLNKIDILVLDHNRQQALGNIFPLLALKKKVYLRSEISTFLYLENLGVKVFDTKTIKDELFSSFIYFNEVLASRNAEIIKKETSVENVMHSWYNLFKMPL